MQATIDRYETMRREMQKELQESFNGFVREFFENNPDIKSIVWTQYTPYFNDGEPCVFNVNDPTYSNSIDGEDVTPWGEYLGEEEGIWAHQGTWGVDKTNQAHLIEAMENFSKVICSTAMEDVMIAMFGDHVKVVCTPDGFDVIDYDHD